MRVLEKVQKKQKIFKAHLTQLVKFMSVFNREIKINLVFKNCYCVCLLSFLIIFIVIDFNISPL